MAGSPSLFEHDLPAGFHYRDNVITNVEERALLDTIAHIAFADFEMRGVVARRRVAFFGQSYDRAPTAPVGGPEPRQSSTSSRIDESTVAHRTS